MGYVTSLRESLERRGVAGSTIAGLLAPAGSTVPGVLASSAVRHAVQFATGRGEIPRAVLTLAEGVLTKTLLSHVSAVLLVVLALGGLILGVGVASTPSRVEVRKAAPPVPPIEEVAPKADRHGDPLPEGALARLGTVRLRQGGAIVHIALSRDGTSLFAKKYGRFEFRVKCPTGKGIWPAIWMLPQDDKYGTWASSGEIDILEARGQEPNKVLGTLHFGSRWPVNAALARPLWRAM